MIKITGLKASPNQTFTIPDPDAGEPIQFTLYYRPRVRRWFFDIAYKDFVLKGSKIVISPNLLYQYFRIIPFGLACISTDNVEPMIINDFSLPRCFLYLLTTAERDQIIEDINSGVIA